jgi:hypothetical protein
MKLKKNVLNWFDFKGMVNWIFIIIAVVAVYLLLIFAYLYFTGGPWELYGIALWSGFTKDVSSCERLTNQSEQSVCFMSIAQEKKDVLFCDKISISNLTAGCYGFVAVKKNDLTICDNYQKEFRNFCYEAWVLRTKDTSICEKMDTRSSIDACHQSYG